MNYNPTLLLDPFNPEHEYMKNLCDCGLFSTVLGKKMPNFIISFISLINIYLILLHNKNLMSERYIFCNCPNKRTFLLYKAKKVCYK